MTEMSRYMLFLTAIIAGAFVGTIATDYCNLKSCLEKRTVHTMCKYPSSTPAASCGQRVNLGLSDAERQAILETHNKCRRKVAAGKETRGNPGPQPKAVSMPDLVWDNELEIIAQRWANQCDFNHDKCRDVERYPVGQNIAKMSSKGNLQPVKNGTMDLVEKWCDEVKDFNKNEVHNFTQKNFMKIGHYTQVVWSATTKLGCGQIRYTNPNKWDNQFMVCNYGPAGNYKNSPVYQIKN